MTSPQAVHRLVGHGEPPKRDICERLRELCFTNGDTDIKWHAADEIDRLRTALRAVRACTDPTWAAQIIKDALREGNT